MQVLRINEVISKTGLSRSTVYELMKAGTFPQSVKLAIRTIGWLEADIDLWIEAKFAGAE
jgi:prophage regulatory protein